MGVLFSVVKLHTTKNVSNMVSDIQEVSLMPPLMNIKQINDESRSNKVAVPYSSSENNEVYYKTVWQPIGTEGWIYKIQALLTNIHDDHITPWFSLNTGQILMVKSNNCDMYGTDGAGNAPYTRLTFLSLWYIDKITLSSFKGNVNMVNMEITLVRRWAKI